MSGYYSRGQGSRIPLKNLDIYNDVYDLGFTETEIDLFTALWEKYKGASFSYVYGEAKNNKDYALVFKDYEPTLKLAAHDDFAKSNGYKLFRLENDRYYLKFVPDAADIKYLDSLSKARVQDQASDIYKSMEEVRNIFFSRDLAHFIGNTLTADDIELIYWAANKVKQFDIRKFTDSIKTNSMPEYVYYIPDVLQLADDTRIAFYIERTRSYYGVIAPGLHAKAYVVKPDNKCYNWTDPDKYFSHIDDKTGHGRIYYSGSNPIFPSEEAMSKYVRGHKFITIENSTLELIEKREQRKALEEAVIQKAQVSLSKKMETKLKELEQGNEFTYNEITFKEDELEYEGQILRCDGIKTKDLVLSLTRNLDDEYFNFERIFERFCTIVTNHARTTLNTPVKGKIGQVDFVVLVRESKNKVLTHYVNSYRINKDEITDVLLRALCYQDNADYENYLESVNKCSLRYHRVIASGIVLTIPDEILGGTVEFKIGLEREKNRNYISYDNKIRYRVKDTNRLLSIQNASDMARVVNVLVDPKVVGVTGKDIRYIIETGRAALELERVKEKEMLNKAIDLFHCEFADEVLLDNGRIKTGYIVKGKLREYLVDSGDLKVFEYPTGKYLCMVDKGQNEHANTARLVSRIFALANDSKLATEITTLAT